MCMYLAGTLLGVRLGVSDAHFCGFVHFIHVQNSMTETIKSCTESAMLTLSNSLVIPPTIFVLPEETKYCWCYSYSYGSRRTACEQK